MFFIYFINFWLYMILIVLIIGFVRFLIGGRNRTHNSGPYDHTPHEDPEAQARRKNAIDAEYTEREDDEHEDS